jgi:hypothetical protein
VIAPLDSHTTPLPRLLDCRAIMAETGVKRATAEALMRECPKVRLPGHRKVFVYADDVAAELARRTEAA